jgi:hypothetical protein
MDLDPPAGPHREVAPQEWPDPSSLAVPTSLLRTLLHNPGPAASDTGILMLAAHAAMLESGFTPAWGGAAASWAALPEDCTVSPSVTRIPYVFVLPTDSTDGGASIPSPCTLTASAMGSSLIVAVSTAGGHAHHVALSASTYLRSGPAVTDAGGENQGATTEGVAVRSNGHGLVINGSVELGGSRLRRLWTALKDGIAFPSLLAAYANAGLPPPAGLLALPADLKSRVLRLLPALELAALSATCTELRHLGSANDLWQPLLERDFPAAPSWITGQRERRGSKWCYAQCHRDRREREEEEGRRRRRRFMAAVPRFHPLHHPAPAPPGFPGMVGGDTDRLPFLGGTGGGLGGLGGPGGMFFGGGGRRQGGAGPGGFRMH